MADYYIDPSGVDDAGRDGSSSEPWLTSSYASSRSTSGDTIIFNDGSYTWNRGDYNFNAVRTFKAANDLKAILDAGGGNVRSYAGSASGITSVEGLLFKDSTQASDECAFYLRNGIDFTFSNCRFQNCEAGTVTSHRKHGGGFIGRDKYADWSGTLNIERSIFDDIYTDGSGVGIITQRQNKDATINMNNCVVNLQTGGGLQVGGIFHGYDAGSTLIINGKNNILYNATGGGVPLYGKHPADSGDWDYNCQYNLSNTFSFEGANQITTDPQFIDPTNGDLRLRQGSPCMETGTII